MANARHACLDMYLIYLKERRRKSKRKKEGIRREREEKERGGEREEKREKERWGEKKRNRGKREKRGGGGRAEYSVIFCLPFYLLVLNHQHIAAT